MENTELKYQNVLGSWTAFEMSIEYYKYMSTKVNKSADGQFAHADLVEIARRSLIQSFEIMTEVLWKHLKWLLEEHFGEVIDIANARGVIAKAVAIRILSESDGQLLLRLVGLRNQTSHIYKEELMDLIVSTLCTSQDSIAAIVKQCNPQLL